MLKLQTINQLLAKAMQDRDSKRVQELRDQLPRAYNDALENEPLLQKKIHAEFSRLDREYFEYCETQHPLPDRAYTNREYTWKHTWHSTLSE